MESWYFAYGSNLSIDQLILRAGKLAEGDQLPRVARLANYRLVFQHLEPGEAAYANIVTPGSGVIGVLYRCSPTALERLDVFEEGYDRLPIAVVDEHGEVVIADVYIVNPTIPVKYGIPDADYLETIVGGARRHGLAATYIDEILAIASASRPGRGGREADVE
jgi:gamma-glutamylcyclotransferase